MEHTVAPAIWCRLKRTRHQATQWEAQDTVSVESGFLPQEQWEPAQQMLDGAVRPQLSSVGADCSLSPRETALRLGDGGRAGLERFNSLVIRERQGQGNSGINIIMALFCMCRLVRPVYSGSSWVQTPNSIVKAG